MIKKNLTNAGLGKASVHTLRHTFGVQNVLRGIKLKTIQVVLGHRDPRSTAPYISVAKEANHNLVQSNLL